MTCPRCQRESLMGADYCTWCGTSLFGEKGPGRAGGTADGVPEMRRELREMGLRLSAVEGRVTLISERMGLRALALQTARSAGGEAALPEVKAGAAPAGMASSGPTRVQAAPVRLPPGPPAPRPPSQFARKTREWEQAMPGNWLSRIGMLVLFIGLGFLTQWAIANHKLERIPLLLVGLVCGGVLLFAGHHWRRDYGAWAQALTGGGIGVLYLSFFASYALYDRPVMPFYATFGLMFLVTVLAVVIALRRESMAIAIIGIVGAFLVPIILGASDLNRPAEAAGQGNPGLMIAYILVLDAGIVWLSTFRNWRWFTLLGFAGSLAVYGLWYANSGHEGPVSPAEWSLTGIFLCFVAATTLFHVVAHRDPKLTDLALMSLNAAVYFCVSSALLWDKYQEWLGLFSVGLCALYAVVGYLAWRRSEDNRLLSLFAFAIAIVFLTIAIPVQLHRSYASWITAAWAAEGAALIWIAVRLRMPKWQLWGLGALGMALVGLFIYNSAIDAERFRPFMNDTFWAFTMSIVAFYAAACFLRGGKDALQPWFFPALVLTASVLTMWLFSAEIVSAAGSKILEAQDPRSLRSIENARSLGLVSLWAGYGFCLLVAGTWRKWDWLRVAAYALVALACGVTAVLLNHHHALVNSSDSLPFINYGFGAFAICIVALYLFTYLASRGRGQFDSFDRPVRILALVVANVLTLWALSGEVITFLGYSPNLRSLVLVILWSGYGLLLMLAGAWKSLPAARFCGYGLIGIAGGIALTQLNHGHAGVLRTNSDAMANYSFGGFLISIAAVYAAAYLMARHSRGLLPGENGVFRILIVAANLLSLYALSAEVLTYGANDSWKTMGLTMLWAAYGLGLVVVGILGRWPWVRLGGLALVAVAVLKLFILDTLRLDAGYRVGAYVAVGLLLLAGGFVYHRYADVIKGFIMDRPENGKQ